MYARTTHSTRRSTSCSTCWRNMQPFDLLILALAAWEASYLVVFTTGPFRLFERFRVAFPLGGLTTCIYCTSVWMAAIAYALMLTPLVPLVYVGAVAGGAMMLHR